VTISMSRAELAGLGRRGAQPGAARRRSHADERTTVPVDFTSRFIEHGTSSGTPMAAIDWGAAITALNAGELPCSGGERRILQLAASLTGGTPVSLRDTVTGLDDHNTARLITALRHATGSSHLRFVITFNRDRRVQGSR
jgi:hypothetical protein